MTTASSRRAPVVWLSCLVGVLVAPGVPARAQVGERRVVLVNVLDRDGNEVPGLGAASFRGEYRGQPVKIVSAALDRAPRRIALIVDTSGSAVTRGQAPLNATWSAVEELVRNLTPHHTVAILTANEDLQKHSELTNDRQTLEQALRQASEGVPWGGSSLYDGVLKTSLALAGTGVGNVVCLFSDGIDTTSTVDVKTAMNAVAGTGVRMFGFGPSHTLSLTSWMESGAEATGGSFYRMESFQEEERRTFDSMITEGYRLEVDLPRVVDEPRKWKLEVVGPDGKELPKVRLVYPRVVAPPVPVASAVPGSGNAPPPRQPDPIKILHEAQRDARAGRYERALEKHLRFHGNALKYERGARGVRLSFALAAWSELAQVHPPALAALRKVRDRGMAQQGLPRRDREGVGGSRAGAAATTSPTTVALSPGVRHLQRERCLTNPKAQQRCASRSCADDPPKRAFSAVPCRVSRPEC